MPNALSAHLIVVVSTNTMRCAHHEVGLGSLEKQKKLLLTTNNVSYMLEFAQRHQFGLFMVGIGWS